MLSAGKDVNVDTQRCGASAGAADSSEDDDDDDGGALLLPKWSYVTALINRFGDGHGFESLQKVRAEAGTHASALMLWPSHKAI